MSDIKHKPYRYLMYFVSAFIACYLIQETLLNRLISLGSGFFITGGSFIYFLSPLLSDVVAEVYGYKIARQMLWCGLATMLLLGVSVWLCLLAPHPDFWGNVTQAYDNALGSLPRSVIMSSIAVFIGQIINVYLIGKWKIMVKGRYFWLRSVGSSLIGETCTTIISIFGIFGDRIPHGLLFHNILPETVVMIVCSMVGAIPATVLQKAVKKAEGIDHYDIGINFNPFKLSTND